jgi:hypothetical protein
MRTRNVVNRTHGRAKLRKPYPSVVLRSGETSPEKQPPKFGPGFRPFPVFCQHARPVRLRGYLRFRIFVRSSNPPVFLALPDLPRPPHHDPDCPLSPRNDFSRPANPRHALRSIVNGMPVVIVAYRPVVVRASAGASRALSDPHVRFSRAPRRSCLLFVASKVHLPATHPA